MYYTQEQIDRANQADLVSFLQSQGEQLTRAGQEYRWNSGKTANGATLRDVTDWVSLSIFTSVSKIYQTICFSVIFCF